MSFRRRSYSSSATIQYVINNRAFHKHWLSHWSPAGYFIIIIHIHKTSALIAKNCSQVGRGHVPHVTDWLLVTDFLIYYCSHSNYSCVFYYRHLFVCVYVSISCKSYNAPELVPPAAEGDSQHGCTLLSVEGHPAILINCSCKTRTRTHMIIIALTVHDHIQNTDNEH